MNRQLRSGLTTLRTTASQTTKVLDRFSSSAERLSLKNSSTLIGCLGGLLGLLIAYVVCLVSAAVSFPVLSVLLSSIGIVGGVLLHRGPRRYQLERRMEENRLASQEVLDRIKALPKNTPAEVKNDLWFSYRSLNSGLSRTLNLDHERLIERKGIPQYALPPAPANVDGEIIVDERQ